MSSGVRSVGGTVGLTFSPLGPRDHRVCTCCVMIPFVRCCDNPPYTFTGGVRGSLVAAALLRRVPLAAGPERFSFSWWLRSYGGVVFHSTSVERSASLLLVTVCATAMGFGFNSFSYFGSVL